MRANSPATNAGATQVPEVSAHPAWRAWLRPAAIVVALGLIIGLGTSTVYRAGPYKFGDREWGSKMHRTDFTVDTAAGQAVLDGTDIYEAHNRRGWYYLYPPLFATLMVPFALMSVFWAALTWYLISVGLVAMSVWMTGAMVRKGCEFKGDMLWLYVVPTLLVLWPLLSALARGQTTPVVLALVVAALYYWWKEREVAGGVCLAGAILLKVFPGALLAYFVWRKRWLLVAATLLTVALGTFGLPALVFGWQKNLGYLRKWVTTIAQPSLRAEDVEADNRLHGQLFGRDLLRNESLQSVLWRITSGARVREVVIGIGLVMVGVIVVVGSRVPSRDELLIVSPMIAWMLVIAPVSWSHYFMLLIVPIAVVTAIAISDANRRTRRAAQIALITYALLGLIGGINRTAQYYGPLCWGTMGLWGACLLAAWDKGGLHQSISEGHAAE